MTRRKRQLSADEQDLWKRVADQTAPMHPRRKKLDPAEAIETPKPKPQKALPPRLEPFRVGQKAGDTAVPASPVAQRKETVNIGRKTHAQLKRGKLKPEAKIDLHGMTLDQAHPALLRFLFSQHDRQRRLVLVITGKGKDRDDDGPIPARRGILRQQVPHWLQAPPLNAIVLQVSEAHLRHGGGGAFYVYLRRGR